MSDEWTFETLRAYLEIQIESLRRETLVTFAANSKAVEKAEVATEHRFESINAFRAQLNDQARTFMPRAEAEATVNRNTQRITEIAQDLGSLITRAELSALVFQGQERADVSNKRLSELEARVTRAEGTDAGASGRLSSIRQTIFVSMAVLGALLTIVTVILDHLATK